MQRLFTHIGGRVFRSSSTDFAAPVYKRIDAVQVGTTAAFTVDVTGNQPASDSVKQVIVGVRSGTSSTWSFVNLTQLASDPTHIRWTGGIPVSGTNEFEYFVQAVDGNGNVAVSTNKGFYFVGSPAPQSSGEIQASLTGTPTQSGWYTNGTSLAVTVPEGVTYQVSVDGGAYKDAPPLPTLTDDGVHELDVRASNGATATLFAPVDTTPPEIVINAPASGGAYVLNSTVPADYFCRDSGSGVVTPCTGSLPNGANIDTSTPGQHTFTVGAVTDAAGHTTPARTVTYTVGFRPILFASARTDAGDIWSMNPDGTGLTRLTTAMKPDEQPTWSPDGTKIAFASRRNDKNGTGLDIYVMDANGQNVVQLTNAKGDDTAPSWSPNGQKIAFQSSRERTRRRTRSGS